MIVQPVNSAYFDEIIEVWESSVRATHDFLPIEKISELKSIIREQYLPNLPIFAALDDKGHVAGFIGCNNNCLEMLFVSPQNRGKGIGKILLQYAITELGINELDVNEQNPQAVGFYQHMGFSQYGRSELDSEGNPFPILHMRLNREEK